MTIDAVPLFRSFSLVSKSETDSDQEDIRFLWGDQKRMGWQELEKKFRCVILAEAGAGKTFEMTARAQQLHTSGCSAFLIRIEDIADGFESAFEVGSVAIFETWLGSQTEAWFFLDSVDEARLVNPRAFEKAIKRFAARIKPAGRRAHIFISSRPYAWRAQSDKDLIERELSFEEPPPKRVDSGEHGLVKHDVADSGKPESALCVYKLDPLDWQGIRIFAKHRGAPQIDRLIADLQRKNLLSMAARPFDLEGILAKWRVDQVLGGRLDLLQHSIDDRLAEIHPDRQQRRPLSSEKARRGARLLAAAVVLTGQPGIRVPDSTHAGAGIDAEVVLGDWAPADVQALLERGIFNDVLYGVVRFRHREIRELLAAEWFGDLLKAGISRSAMQSLFIREQYGRLIITPRLRPVLPWLILFDAEIRTRVLKIAPEISIEGGDAACLPLPQRRALLMDIVQRIADDRGDSASDNSAIARIAHADLADDVCRLVDTYNNNDDALFFLARLVWQGEITACVPALAALSLEAEKGIYVRLAATRAVMTCGNRQQKDSLWAGLLESPEAMPRRLLAEILGGVDPDIGSVENLLRSIGKLDAYQAYRATGLNSALHNFVDRLPADDVMTGSPLLVVMIQGLNSYLARQPYADDRGGTKVSRDFVWLLGLTAHVIERLVISRSAAALSPEVLSVMVRLPSARFGYADEFKEYKSRLHELVPQWQTLNDALFWKSVEESRRRLRENGSERLTGVWRVCPLGHYWSFGVDRFDDVLGFIAMREFLDDQLILLTLALQLFVQAERPGDWLDRLNQAARVNIELQQKLAEFLHPVKSQSDIDYERKQALRENRLKARDRLNERCREQWVERLKATPEVVLHPPRLAAGEMSNDQLHLLKESGGLGFESTSSHGSGWQSLVITFGMEVAQAYRSAAIAHWRAYVPALGSEGGDTRSIPYALIFAMEGLSIEANEVDGFYKSLTEQDARHASRYVVWELNGLPYWFEPLYQAHPRLVLDAVWVELRWELAGAAEVPSTYYILDKLIHFAPWLHVPLGLYLFTWLKDNEVKNADDLRGCVQVMLGGGVDESALSELSQLKIADCKINEQLPIWYALWIYLDATQAVPAAKAWLSCMAQGDALEAAQRLAANLMGESRRPNIWPGRGSFFNAQHLQSLYLLMCQYIKMEDDIDHANGKVYSPGLRDNAQRARDALFNWLSEIPGKDTYVALRRLAQSHPVAKYRPWIAKLAYGRAEKDGDLDCWTAQQVRDYDQGGRLIPTTHRQLFDLAVNRLVDLKGWVEQGNDSPYQTWQRAEGETEMRNLVAGWLGGQAHGCYSCAQENEFANQQRPDILIQSASVSAPVPIELKLLDKDWTGPTLCERLRNQLVGGYLREHTAEYGIMLLVWQGRAAQKRWQIGHQRIHREGLPAALHQYWETISDQFPGVAGIKVVLIDLTVRGEKSVA